MSNFQGHLGILTNDSLTLEKLWELKKFKPNEKQEEAITHTEGPLYITAGPGSGKTRVLLWQVVNLIVFQDVPPEEIFLSTFTEKAAHQLVEGLRELLGYATNLNGKPYDLAGMYVGTVHSLCRRMLTDRRRFFFDRQRHKPPTLLDELGQYFHISRTRIWNEITAKVGLDPIVAKSIINAVFGRESQSKHRAVVNCISIFNRFSEEMISPQESLELLSNPNQELLDYLGVHNITTDDLKLLFELYQTYRDSLQANPNLKLTDFSLLQQEAYQLLTDSETSGQAFLHVIVDEYQDTNTIQERIFFKLAAGTGNICVVGDDDQALYRFRGATVENFVEFPSRCENYLNKTPHWIPLYKNYRSRNTIVDFFSDFIEEANWAKESGQRGFFRVMGKKIEPDRNDNHAAVVTTPKDKPEAVCAQVAKLVGRLIDTGKVENPNQIAFLYPSLKSVQVGRMISALENQGLQVYAPRAGRFLEVEESKAVFGILLLIFGRPGMRGMGRELEDYRSWLTEIEGIADRLVKNDPRLARFIQDRQDELGRVGEDYLVLSKVIEKNNWNLKEPYDLRKMKRSLVDAISLSSTGKKILSSAYLDQVVQKRQKEGIPYSLEYIVHRAASVDWNVLDLFYRMCGFNHFKHMFDLAERNGDEGPIANLSLITEYLQRFIDDRIPMITGNLLVEDNIFQRVLFSSYLFALFRLGQSEYEDADDPFPKGRIPFLTIHQAKGLEFPIVVLGNLYKLDRGPSLIEKITRPFLDRDPGEPLARMSKFDIMRMFYVALSRAKNLLILTRFRNLSPAFKTMFQEEIPLIKDLDLGTIPSAEIKDDDLPKTYSFTSDFLLYNKCPRQYMVFKKFGFVPSRAQTMFFGSLVHRTLEDLHHELIRRREQI